MTPFLSDRTFRFENELDNEVHAFFVGMTVYQGALDSLEGIEWFCQTAEFREIFAQRGRPTYDRFYFPRVGLGHVKYYSPDLILTSEFTGPMKQFPQQAELLLRIRQCEGKPITPETRKLRLHFYRRVIGARCTIIESICSGAFGTSIATLIEGVRLGKSLAIRQDCFLKLVKLDPGCIGIEGAEELLRESALASDRKLFDQLSKALDPKRRAGEYLDMRNKHALSLLAYSIHYEDRGFEDFLNFFRYYNDTIRQAPGYLPSWQFPGFNQRDALRKALDQFSIRYNRRTKGRPRKSPK